MFRCQPIFRQQGLGTDHAAQARHHVVVQSGEADTPGTAMQKQNHFVAPRLRNFDPVRWHTVAVDGGAARGGIGLREFGVQFIHALAIGWNVKTIVVTTLDGQTQNQIGLPQREAPALVSDVANVRRLWIGGSNHRIYGEGIIHGQLV